MFCPRCGKQLGGTEKFCPNCGFDLALPSSTAATNAEAAATPQKPLAPRVPAQPVPGPMPTSKTVAPAELVTLTAALLVGIAAFLPFLVVSGISYDYSVALTDAPDGAVLVLLAIATAVLPMMHRRIASLVLAAVTTVFSLVEVCSVWYMMLNSTHAAYYTNFGAGFCLLVLGIVVGVISVILLARDNAREKPER